MQKISVMGGEQAANVLCTVKMDQMAKKGESFSEMEQNEFKKPILENMKKRKLCLFFVRSTLG